MFLAKIIKRFYNERFEDFATRVLYFFNTIDTYFLVAGIVSFIAYALYTRTGFNPVVFLLVTVSVCAVFKLADFYPLFTLLSPVYLFFLFRIPAVSFSTVALLLALNMVIFAAIQFLFMSIPESIVARDPTIGIRKLWNSVFTIAPTTVSLTMSVFFSTLYALILIAKPNPLGANGLLFWATIIGAAFISFFVHPRSFRSENYKPPIKGRIADRVIIVNIDGCRLDRFYEANLPYLTVLRKEATYFPQGIETVYRALTNPAFASILTGAVPTVHGVKSNNLGQKIKVEALPDIVKSRLYGSMHMKHFSKANWDTRIVSLPTYGIYASDDIMFDLLKKDLLSDEETRLFIADISETDFMGHAYGSESRQYLEALRRADEKIGQFIEWLKTKNIFNNSVVIVCSDHGISQIDHSYLLFDAEKHVPFLMVGKGVSKGKPINSRASIMDIAPTVSYFLGVKYPARSEGRVLTEAID